MTKPILYISILIILLSCEHNSSELESTWFCKYSISNSDGNEKNFDLGTDKLIDFKEDSLTIKKFNLHFPTRNENPETYKYKILDNNKIITKNSSSVDTINYSIINDTMKWVFEETNQSVIFQKIKKYNLANKKSEFHKLLLSSSFELFDSIRMEFTIYNNCIIKNKSKPLSQSQNWLIDTYNSELFLQLKGVFGIVLHVTNINSKGFSGNIYSNTDKELKFNLLPKVVNKNIHQLNGKWKEYIADTIPPPPPPILHSTKTYYEEEHLYIDDSIIVKSFIYRIDTLFWEPNNEHDILILRNSNDPYNKKYWTIVSLTENELVIDREPRFSFKRGVEQIKYKRI